jgi:hypothetical protein
MFFVVLFAIIGAFLLNRGEQAAETGNVTRQTRSIQPFNQLRLDGVFEVYLKQGEKESLQVEAREGLQSRIRVDNDGNTLTLKLEKGGRLRKTNIKIYLTLRELDKLTVNGVVNIRTENTLQLARLRMEHHSVGDTRLSLRCDALDAHITGVGSLRLEGAGNHVKLHNTGVGEINASQFEADVLLVENTGVGNVEVNARREISIRSTGVGSVRYRGLATVKEMQKSGVGSITKI